MMPAPVPHRQNTGALQPKPDVCLVGNVSAIMGYYICTRLGMTNVQIGPVVGLADGIVEAMAMSAAQRAVFAAQRLAAYVNPVN